MLLKQKRGKRKREKNWDRDRDRDREERERASKQIFISPPASSISVRFAAGQMTYLQFLAVGEKTLKYFQIGNYEVYYLVLK